MTIVHFAKLPDPALDDLMSEYVNLGPHVKYQSVDPEQKPDVAKQYGATHMGDLIAASGSVPNASSRALGARWAKKISPRR